MFSTSDVLLDDSRRERVPGAVAAGAGLVTRPTDRGALATDIGQDFDATDTCLVIPPRARFVFFGTFDTYYADNTSIDGDPLGVLIRP